tara:strand:- start:43 stop:297 length:255 start_codon:yes stop_codon:yes gene_type:complete
MIKQHSLEAWIDICTELGRRQKEVLEGVKRLKLCTRLDLSDHLNKPINSITPRVNELMRKNLLVESGSKINPSTNKRAALLMVV